MSRSCPDAILNEAKSWAHVSFCWSRIILYNKVGPQKPRVIDEVKKTPFITIGSGSTLQGQGMAYMPVPTILLIDKIDGWLIPIYCSCWSGNFPKAGDCQISKLHLTCWRKKQEKTSCLDLPGKKTDVVTPSWKWTKFLSCSSLKSFFRSALLVLPWLCDNMLSNWSWTSFQTEQLIIKSHQQEKDHATSWNLHQTITA